MKIKYVVIMRHNLCEGDYASDPSDLFPNRGCQSASAALRYATKIVEYCEENYGVKTMCLDNSDLESPTIIDLTLMGNNYKHVTIEIENCNFEVEEP